MTDRRACAGHLSGIAGAPCSLPGVCE